MDKAFKEAIRGIGRLTNTKMFWIPGLGSGFLGLLICLTLVPATAPERILYGMVSFLVLFLGVGYSVSIITGASRRKD